MQIDGRRCRLERRERGRRARAEQALRDWRRRRQHDGVERRVERPRLEIAHVAAVDRVRSDLVDVDAAHDCNVVRDEPALDRGDGSARPTFRNEPANANRSLSFVCNE